MFLISSLRFYTWVFLLVYPWKIFQSLSFFSCLFLLFPILIIFFSVVNFSLIRSSFTHLSPQCYSSLHYCYTLKVFSLLYPWKISPISDSHYFYWHFFLDSVFFFFNSRILVVSVVFSSSLILCLLGFCLLYIRFSFIFSSLYNYTGRKVNSLSEDKWITLPLFPVFSFSSRLQGYM